MSAINNAYIAYDKYGPNSNWVMRYLLKTLPQVNWYSLSTVSKLTGYNTLLPGLEFKRPLFRPL